MTAQPAKPYTATWAVWLILGGLGSVEVAFNVYHAVHGGLLQPILGVLLGVAPVYAAILLAHVVAANDCGKAVRAVLFAVMAGAMAVSIGAIAVTAAPVAWGGIYGAALFGLVLDGASLTALWVITGKHQQKAAEAAELEAARAAAKAAASRAEQAAGEAAGLRAELDQVRAELATAAGRAQGLGSADQRAREASAEAARLRDELTAVQALLATAQGEASGLRDASARADQAAAQIAGLREQMDARQAELTAALVEIQGLKAGLNKRRGSGRKPARGSGSGSGRGSGAGSAPARTASSGLNHEEPADIDTQAEALSIYLAEPGISGSELGRRLGKSESYGCRLKREMDQSAAGAEVER